ncbi:hypothetical protein BDZ89DRAFT_1140620 [Hymenopellis radicata]|nr:hypothetical protein BDZ89DRAFT_1140620 [Hymenopellis radicata]
MYRSHDGTSGSAPDVGVVSATAPEINPDIRRAYRIRQVLFWRTVSLYWNPFLSSTRVNDLINTDIYASRTVRRPAMLVLESGLWHLRYAEAIDLKLDNIALGHHDTATHPFKTFHFFASTLRRDMLLVVDVLRIVDQLTDTVLEFNCARTLD